MSYDINSNILSPSGVTADQLSQALDTLHPGNGFASASMFTDAEAKYGINALFIAAHAAIESAWGSSYYAATRNNLFGFNAVDSNPDQASTYPTQGAAVDFYASFLLRNYLMPSGPYFNGSTPHGVFVMYSSSHDAEAQSVVDIMNELADLIPQGELMPNEHQCDLLWQIAFNRSIEPAEAAIYADKVALDDVLTTLLKENFDFRTKAANYDKAAQMITDLQNELNAEGTAAQKLAQIQAILGSK